MRSAKFNLNEAVLLQAACLNDPLVDPVVLFSREAKVHLALKIGATLIALQKDRDVPPVELALSVDEAWHLLQSIDIQGMTGGEPTGLNAITKLYKVLVGYDADGLLEGAGLASEEADAALDRQREG